MESAAEFVADPPPCDLPYLLVLFSVPIQPEKYVRSTLGKGIRTGEARFGSSWPSGQSFNPTQDR